MTIADEIREAAEEMAFSFSQEAWPSLVVFCVSTWAMGRRRPTCITFGREPAWASVRRIT